MNWVTQVLADATKAVNEWPAWMRSPQVRFTESLTPPIKTQTDDDSLSGFVEMMGRIIGEDELEDEDEKHS